MTTWAVWIVRRDSQSYTKFLGGIKDQDEAYRLVRSLRSDFHEEIMDAWVDEDK